MSANLLSTSDAARLLNCTPENVRKLNRLGRLTAQRTLGGQRIFQLSEIERLLAERAQKSQARSVGVEAKRETQRRA